MYTNKVKKIAAVHDLSGAGRVSLTVVIPYPLIHGLSSLPSAHSRIIQPHPIPALLLLGPHGRDAQDYQRMEATEDTV